MRQRQSAQSNAETPPSSSMAKKAAGGNTRDALQDLSHIGPGKPTEEIGGHHAGNILRGFFDMTSAPVT